MIIYLEGPDASGKSTLKASLTARLKTLSSIRNITVVPDGEKLIPTRPNNPNRIEAKALLKNISNMANDLNVVYICDRGPISDIIYRAFDDFNPVINLYEYWLLWLGHNQLIVTIHCDTDLSILLLRARGDDNPIAITHHVRIRYLYQQIMPLFTAFKFDLSTIKDDNDQLQVNNVILARLWSGLESYKRVFDESYLRQKGEK